MFASPTAMWLDTHLAGFDHLFLSIQHFFGDKLGVVLTPLMRLITFLGEKGWIFFLLAVIFMLMANRRDLGVCIFGAVCCGALITNIILKDNVARVRPFEASAEFNNWWITVGSPMEDGFSFPSGHVTACAAGMTAITCMRGRKWLVPSIVVVLVMAISRNYLMAHYPSDVLAAAVIGVFSGVVAWFITQFIFRFLRRNRSRIPACGVILDFDIRDVLPFRLPALPFGKAAPSGDPAPRSTRGSRATSDSDEDVKTYAGSGKHSIPAASDAPVRSYERAPRAAASARASTVPARSASAPARSGGRHVIESAQGGSRARKSHISAPGGYQGKH